MSSKIVQFMEVTGATAEDATRWLEIAAGDIDSAVMFYFEYGDNQHYPQAPAQQPPQPLKQIANDYKRQPVANAQPNAPQSTKRGIFGFTKKYTQEPAPYPTQNVPYTQPFFADNYQKPQYKKPQGTQQGNIYYPNFDYPTDKDKLFVDGGVKNGGSGTSVYAPTKDYDITIHQFKNGCLIRDQFFPFSDPQFKATYVQMFDTKIIPHSLFSKFPEDYRPKPDYKINAQIQNHDSDYDASKSSDTNVVPAEHYVYEWNENEKGRVIGGYAAARVVSSTVYPANVNLNFRVPNTYGTCRIKIRAQQAFVVEADPTTRITELLTALRNNGGLPGVQNLATVHVKHMSGELIQQNSTIQSAGVAGKQIAVTW